MVVFKYNDSLRFLYLLYKVNCHKNCVSHKPAWSRVWFPFLIVDLSRPKVIDTLISEWEEAVVRRCSSK